MTMEADPRLENELKLKNLINSESVGNLCASFSELVGTGVRVTELDGTPVYGGLDPESPELGCPVVETGRCEACASVPARAQNGEKIERLQCTSGAVCVRARIDNQFDPVGWILVGPFVDGAVATDEAVPSADKGQSFVHFLCTVLEEIVFANYQGYLVSKANLQGYTENMSELLDKDRELHDYQKTLEESKTFRGMF